MKVHDVIRVPPKRGRVAGALAPISSAKTKSRKALSDAVSTLYKGEDLVLEKFDLNLTEHIFDLSVTLRVHFPDSTNAARLCLSPTYLGGLKPDAPSDEDSEAMLEILNIGGAKFLFFPKWELPEDDRTGAQTIASLLNIDFSVQEGMQQDSDLRIQCVLRTGKNGQHETLLDYAPETPPLNGPDLKLLDQLQSAHPLSGNDLRRLFTKFKLAKAGYYPVGENIFTNRPPISVAKQSHSVPPHQKRKISPQAQVPATTISIDGNFDDWSSTTPPQEKPAHGWIPTVYYRSDSNYVYVFLGFQPSLESRFKQGETSWNIAEITCDTDSDPNTGCNQAKTGPLGTDLMIRVGGGTRVEINGSEKRISPTAGYSVDNWSNDEARFETLSHHGSTDSLPLINHGSDGVELAIPRSVFGNPTNKIDFVTKSGGFPVDLVQILAKLK
ncbi:MAG TPA: hypothetical protein VFZ59_26110 [Verrucomicrobiae bacterium]|nr:hypothetical protein [Verrucomicrobiae bacterium]